jgi:histidyl-tRNA synthetase
MNSQIQNIKRYHIAKVYRRDQPAMNKGRMREFYQCDFDIAGSYDSMLPDAEIMRITCEIFEALGWKGRYTIKLNHRKILDGIFEVCGVPADKIRAISSAVDKLDKSPWEEVRREMTEDKGLDGEVADKIGEYVVLKGGRDILEKLRSDEKLVANGSAKQGLEDIELLFGYLESFEVLDRISFDMSLARGLDYYTGVIYEVVTEGSAPQTSEAQKQAGKKAKKVPEGEEDRSNDPTIGVGSVAAGGRYDNLVGMFSGKQQVPCVGISFGVERIFSITKQRLAADASAAAIRSNEVDVYVMAFGGKGFDGLLKQRMQVARKLWDAGIKAEFSWKVKPKLPAQFKAAEVNGVPFAVILGDEELAAGKCRIKELGLPEGHPEKDGVMVELENVDKEVKSRLNKEGVDASITAGLGGMTLDQAASEAPKTT